MPEKEAIRRELDAIHADIRGVAELTAVARSHSNWSAHANWSSGSARLLGQFDLETSLSQTEKIPVGQLDALTKDSASERFLEVARSLKTIITD